MQGSKTVHGFCPRMSEVKYCWLAVTRLLNQTVSPKPQFSLFVNSKSRVRSSNRWTLTNFHLQQLARTRAGSYLFSLVEHTTSLLSMKPKVES